MIKFTATDTDNIYYSAYWGYWGHSGEAESVNEENQRTSWVMHLNDPNDVDNYTPKRIDAESLAWATENLHAGNVKIGSYLRNQLTQDLIEWENNPEYGVPFDSELSDVIVQVACFGSVIFG